MAYSYQDEESYEVTPVNGFWAARTGAYIADSIFILFPLSVFIIAFFSFEFFIGIFTNILFLLLFLLLFGVFQVLYYVALEGTGERSYTIGKSLVNLEVISLDGGPVTGGQAFKRNISKIFLPLILIDMLAGIYSNMKEDYSQKRSDISARTAIQRYQMAVAPPPRRPYYKPVTPKDSEEDTVQKYGDFPAHLLNGECPKCHSPYKIVPSEDKTTWSGLWNTRCTWCNKLVFESGSGRVQPGKWT
jgi:uncharacterized RDD family membrane protein YckC/phage FluMu protein Com